MLGESDFTHFFKNYINCIGAERKKGEKMYNEPIGEKSNDADKKHKLKVLEKRLLFMIRTNIKLINEITKICKKKTLTLRANFELKKLKNLEHTLSGKTH